MNTYAPTGCLGALDSPSSSTRAVSDITMCLRALGRGDNGAADELLPLVYDDLRKHAAVGMAREYSYQTLQPTALVHEAWLRIVDDSSRKWANRAHFFGAAAQAMRRILIENARRKSRLKRGGNRMRVEMENLDLAETTPEENILLIDEALERLKAHDADKARIVELKVFWGCTTTEVAETMEMSERSVERQWAYAKAWLFRCIRQQQQ
ncbi:MAG: ECF subfamily RNA polymerase sigma-24 factor [Puniceicoccaceae bacterium 5H]|nr:MAG: ECF subfamily RNA polymerase sigma-24 factor [Puniceicoccaceae bacterium 5H]